MIHRPVVWPCSQGKLAVPADASFDDYLALPGEEDTVEVTPVDLLSLNPGGKAPAEVSRLASASGRQKVHFLASGQALGLQLAQAVAVRCCAPVAPLYATWRLRMTSGRLSRGAGTGGPLHVHLPLLAMHHR